MTNSKIDSSYDHLPEPLSGRDENPSAILEKSTSHEEMPGPSLSSLRSQMGFLFEDIDRLLDSKEVEQQSLESIMGQVRGLNAKLMSKLK